MHCFFTTHSICRRGPIRLNRISSDPQPNTTSPTTLCKPPHQDQDRSKMNATNPWPNAGLSRHKPLPNPANQLFGANTPFNSAQPPPANPFDQRTPPRKVAAVGDLSVKQATITPSLPSSLGLPPAPFNLCPPAPAPPTLQPPAPPILQPGWEQGGSIPNLAAGPKSKVTAAYGWNGWPSENSPAPHLPQPKLEPAQQSLPLTGIGSLSQQLEQYVNQGVVDEAGVSPPRLHLASVPLNSAHAPVIMPLHPGQFVDPSAETPPLAEQPNLESGMVICPLCPVPGLVLRNDLDHARNMHR